MPLKLARENPAGRNDVLLARLAEKVADHVGGGEMYRNAGVGEVVEELIRRTVPNRAYTPVELAEMAGLLPPAPKAKQVRRVR